MECVSRLEINMFYHGFFHFIYRLICSVIGSFNQRLLTGRQLQLENKKILKKLALARSIASGWRRMSECVIGGGCLAGVSAI